MRNIFNEWIWFVNKCVIVVLTVGFHPLCLGQKMMFEHLNSENGLSQNSVLSITQDSRGFMWYGTRLGLNRYDGHAFKIYKSDPSDTTTLTGNYIISLLADSRKTLWVGTQNGLNKYNPLTNTFDRIKHNDQREGTISANTINCLYEDRKGTLWVGTFNGLNQLIDRDKLRFKTYNANPTAGLPSNNVRAIFEDHAGNLWIGTSSGLTKMTARNGQYTFQTYRHDAGIPGSLSDSYVATITEDAHHTLWVGTLSGGLNRFNETTNTFTHFVHSNTNPASLVHNNIRKIMPDKRGKLWVGTQEGLSVIDPVTLSIESYKHDPANKKSLNKNSIYSIVEDAHGTIWIGTYYGGVNVSYAHHTDFTVYQNSTDQSSISDDVVSSITEDKTDSGNPRNLWIATEGGGLNYFNRRAGAFTAYKHNPAIANSLGSNLVKTVYQDRQGAIWAGTHGGGLNLFDPVHKTFQRFLFTANDAASLSAEVLAILEDNSGKFWVGTQQGLHEFQNARPPLVALNTPGIKKILDHSTVKVLLEDQDKNIWIGTGYGLYWLKPNSVKVDTFTNHLLKTAIINCIREDRHGRIWVGTYHEGVIVYDKRTRQTTNYTTKDGLANNDVAGILEDNNGFIWISTGNGLSRFDPSTASFINYTTSDGLAGNDFNYGAAFKSATNELFFGGYQGLTSFVADKIHVTKNATPIVFTALRLFNKPVAINGDDKLLGQDISLTNAITFRHDQNVFSLDFALLNYIKSNKNKYAYKLEGFDHEWNYTTIPSATYTNLPAGSYTFWVKGANNDGLWSHPIQLSIEVLPPFWKTWWAYTLYALALVGVFVFITRYFILQALLKRDHELNQIKLNFFTNISHEIRTHLTLIAGPIERLLLARKDDPLVQQQLGHVQNDAERLLKLVNELMDFRKAETNNLKLHIAKLDLVPFLNDIFLFFKEVSLSKNITTSFSHNVDAVEVYADKEQLEKVFFNLLSNAYKFTPDGGQISLVIESQADAVSVQVTDNGRGIAPQYLNKLFDNFFQVDDHGIQNTGYGIGLALSKTIVELHKGHLNVESHIAPNPADNRTCFTIRLQTGSKHLKELLAQTPIPDPLASSAIPLDSTPIQQHIALDHAPERQIGPEESVPAFDKMYTILLVEDNPAVRAFISDSLTSTYQVVACTNGLAGWEAAIDLIPDLIISDVMMPEMDGFTLCNQLKTDERTNHIPVILLTAKSAIASQVSGLAMGADSYLTKPFSLQVLELHIRNLLATREKMRQRFSRHVTLQPQNIEVSTVDEQFLNKVMQIIETHLDNPDFDVDRLSAEVGMSRSVLYKKLKALTDMSVNDFIKSTRLQKATLLLQQKKLTIYEVAYAVGFSDRKYFSKEFKKQFGKTPSEYINIDEPFT